MLGLHRERGAAGLHRLGFHDGELRGAHGSPRRGVPQGCRAARRRRRGLGRSLCDVVGRRDRGGGAQAVLRRECALHEGGAARVALPAVLVLCAPRRHRHRPGVARLGGADDRHASLRGPARHRGAGHSAPLGLGHIGPAEVDRARVGRSDQDRVLGSHFQGQRRCSRRRHGEGGWLRENRGLFGEGRSGGGEDRQVRREDGGVPGQDQRVARQAPEVGCRAEACDLYQRVEQKVQGATRLE
mmetsp:Transcript_10515/g.30524  ORF Transcript_10515/g.30524 Transcript_10515/m.30524 type:complete len:242 (-) Transcript_10515:557-1282(-)